MTSPLLGLPEMLSGSANREVIHNDANATLEALTGRCISKGANSPPTSNEGDVYIVGSAPTGAWSGFSPNDIVNYYNGAWQGRAPYTDQYIYIADIQQFQRWSGTAWVEIVIQATGIPLAGFHAHGNVPGGQTQLDGDGWDNIDNVVDANGLVLYDDTTDPTIDRFVVQTGGAGLYVVSGGGYMESSANSTELGLITRVNGVADPYAFGFGVTRNNVGGNWIVSSFLQLVANDYVDFEFYVSTGTLDWFYQNLSCYRIGV